MAYFEQVKIEDTSGNALNSNGSGALKVDGSAVTQPVSGTVTAGAKAAQPALVTTLSPNNAMPAVVQVIKTTGTGTQASLQSAAFTGTAGNTLVVLVGTGDVASITITDTIGHNYTYVGDIDNAGNIPSSWIYYVPNIIGGSNQVTVTPATSTSIAFVVYEVSGIVSPQGGWPSNTDVTTTLFDAAVLTGAMGIGTSASPSATTIGSINQCNCIAFAVLALATTNSAPTLFQPWHNDAALTIGGTPNDLVGVYTYSVGIGNLVTLPNTLNFAATVTSAPWAVSMILFGGTLNTNVNIASPIDGNSNVMVDVSGIDEAVISTTGSGSGQAIVGIVGNTGGILDAANTAATAPARGMLTLVKNVTTPPSLTTGQSVAIQADYAGSLFTKPYRRSSTAVGFGTFTSASATSLLASQGSGVFADLGSISITVGQGATANVYFTVNLSDGTNTYEFNVYSSDGVTIAPMSPISVTFDPPIKATSAATAWTIALSSTTDTPTVNVIATFVLQKAS